jgi:hypothetical protein
MRVLKHERGLELLGLGDDAAAVGSRQPGDHPQQRRLSASGRTQHGQKLSRVDAEVQALDHDEVIFKDSPDPVQAQRDTMRRNRNGSLSHACRSVCPE